MKPQIDYNDVSKRIGKTIAKYRQLSGLTQEQVAELLDVGNEAISRMERGLIIPNVVRLIELAEIFSCSVADLITEGSPRLSDQTNHVHHLINGLNETDRELMLHFLRTFSQRLSPSTTTEMDKK